MAIMVKPLLSKKKELALQQTLGRAMEFHRAGQLGEAERLYQEILAVNPRQIEAQHLLGVLRAQQGRLDEALELVTAALKVRPNAVIPLSDCGLILHKLGRHQDALARLDAALAIKPDHAPALSNRGNVLTALRRYDEALASYAEALRIRPDYPEALANRGNALAALARYDEALASYGKALALRPRDPDALNGRAGVLAALGRHDEALADYDGALAARPGYAEAHYGRGNALAALDRIDEALAAYDAAIAAAPDHLDALANRGNALQQLGRIDDALACYDRALALSADHAGALNNRGTALKNLRRYEEALADYDRALASAPQFADALYNRANVLKELRRYEEALAAYDSARAVKPDHSDAHGAMDAALAICDWDRASALAGPISEAIAAGRPFTPFTLIGYSDDAALHRKCAESFIADRIRVRPAPLSRARPSRTGKIRIAYLSADLHSHATAFLIAELIERHDRGRFEVMGVSFGRDDGSDMRRRLIAGFDRFEDVRGQGDREIAALLHERGVDIAIDLKGYTLECRPEIFSHRAAPVQVNYLGYPGTMGTDFIDYVIADPVVLPFDRQAFYAEKIVQLPDSYQANDRQRRIADITPSRREADLPEDGFVFCCFNNTYKIARPVFDVWMRILKATPGSVLWLLRDSAATEANLRREAAARGVDPARIVFAGRKPLDEHLARHMLADLFLDTLPYNAHTTASDALWAGLPVLTCRGEAFAGRVAASLLHAVGLPELVTGSLDAYEALALRLAAMPAELGDLRGRLARNRQTHPLFDTDRFCRHIEAAYTTMWETWQRGEAPRSFAVGAIERPSRTV